MPSSSASRAAAATVSAGSAATTPARAARRARWPKNAAPPVLVEMRRGRIVDSRHRGHVVAVGADGAVDRAIGDPEAVVSLRSAIKPFTLLALIQSGAADAFHITPSELALFASSHMGDDLHVRTLLGVFRRTNVSQNLLGCGSDGAPRDRLTAARLARDGETPGPARHMCSGQHAASILLSRHMGWPPDEYWQPQHPSQVLAREMVARCFAVRPDALVTAIDACGVQAFAFPLVDVARAFALLADPSTASTPEQVALAPALTRVRDAMSAAPEMVGGPRDNFDTALMKALPGRVVAKGGAEGLLGMALMGGEPNGTSGTARSAGGLAVAIDDGDGYGRAVSAVTVEALAQLGVVDEAGLRHLARWHRPAAVDPRGQRVGEAVPEFQLAPISELA